MTYEPHQPPPPLHSYEFFAPDWITTENHHLSTRPAKRMATTPPAPDRVVMRQGIFATKPDEIERLGHLRPGLGSDQESPRPGFQPAP